MKTTGRRRWRKAIGQSGRGRIFYGPETKREKVALVATEYRPSAYLPAGNISEFMRRHKYSMKTREGVSAAIIFGSLSAKSFSARSLCGMSNACRISAKRMPMRKGSKALITTDCISPRCVPRSVASHKWSFVVGPDWRSGKCTFLTAWPATCAVRNPHSRGGAGA